MASDGNYTQGPTPGGGAYSHQPSNRHERILFASLMSFLLLLLLLVVCCCIGELSRRRTQRVGDTTTVAATTTSVAGDGRLSAEARSSLPIFVYASVAHDVKLECAVCLMEFKEGEEGRLLPRCYHSFHTECVDMWFDSHSTCPLCRSRVEPESPS